MQSKEEKLSPRVNKGVYSTYIQQMSHPCYTKVLQKKKTLIT